MDSNGHVITYPLKPCCYFSKLALNVLLGFHFRFLYWSTVKYGCMVVILKTVGCPLLYTVTLLLSHFLVILTKLVMGKYCLRYTSVALSLIDTWSNLMITRSYIRSCSNWKFGHIFFFNLTYWPFQGGTSFCGSFVLCMSCVCHGFSSVHCCHVVTCWERADLLALVCDV